MTLTTCVRIVEPTAVRPVFDMCRRLLGAENALYVEEGRFLRNRAFQGYDALLWVEWGPDGLLPVEEDDNRPRASIEVSFDTPYGYRSPTGASCRDLHAWLVLELGRWLDQRDLTWYWENEFEGEWYLRMDRLAEFGDPAKGALAVAAE